MHNYFIIAAFRNMPLLFAEWSQADVNAHEFGHGKFSLHIAPQSDVRLNHVYGCLQL